MRTPIRQPSLLTGSLVGPQAPLGGATPFTGVPALPGLVEGAPFPALGLGGVRSTCPVSARHAPLCDSYDTVLARCSIRARSEAGSK